MQVKLRGEQDVPLTLLSRIFTWNIILPFLSRERERDELELELELLDEPLDEDELLLDEPLGWDFVF